MTPLPLARALVATLKPSGRILEPCRGTGAFVRALRPYGHVETCELSEGRDFLQWTERVDWIVTNPPWSKFKAFLQHALVIADHIAFVTTVNHLWTKSRRAMIRDAGFGLHRIIEFDAPAEWRPTGFQLGMIVLVRNHQGPCEIEQLMPG